MGEARRRHLRWAAPTRRDTVVRGDGSTPGALAGAEELPASHELLVACDALRIDSGTATIQLELRGVSA